MRCFTGFRGFFSFSGISQSACSRTTPPLWLTWGIREAPIRRFSVAQAILRLCEAHGVRLVPQFIPGRLNVLADTLSCCSQVLELEWTLCFPAFLDLLLWPATIDLFATSLNHRLPVYFSADGRSTVGVHGCDDAVVGWSAGLCLPSLRPAPARHLEGPAVSGVGAHVGSSILASTSLFSGPSGASGDCPSVPSMLEGATQTASFPSFPPEPPRASPDCVSYIERSACTFVSLQRWLGNLPTADAPPPE